MITPTSDLHRVLWLFCVACFASPDVRNFDSRAKILAGILGGVRQNFHVPLVHCTSSFNINVYIGRIT